MKKTGIRICVLLLAVVMLLSVLMPAVTSLAGAKTVTKDDIQNYENSLQDVKNRQDELNARLDELKDDKNAAEEKLELLQEQILLTEQQIGDSQNLLDSYDQQIQDKKAEITQLEEQEDQQYDEFYTQTRWMEENGGASFISIIFHASSFSELLDYMMLVTDIMDYNDKIITQLEETQTQLAQARDDLQSARDDQAATQKQLENAKADLTSKKKEADEYYQQLLKDEDSYNSEVAKLQSEEKQIQADLEKAQETYDKQQEAAKPKPPSGGGSPVVDPAGNWYWPLPGYYGISSWFGGRYDPFTGQWDSHTGTDVPAPGGTPIQCAKDGVVTTVVPESSGSSYGNYCIVYHGDGYATLYAHMKYTPNVTVGQNVSAGDVIGYVGTTGRSNGNHLHYELRINGQRADALDLYPNLSFYG